MIVFGGFIGGATDTNDVWTLNLTSYKWTERTTSATKPSVRNAHSSILYDGKMVVFGGWGYE